MKTSLSSKFFDCATFGPRQAYQAFKTTGRFVSAEFEKTLAGDQTIGRIATIGIRYTADLYAGAARMTYQDLLKHSEKVEELDRDARTFVRKLKNLEFDKSFNDPLMRRLLKELPGKEIEGFKAFIKEYFDSALDEQLAWMPMGHGEPVYLVRGFISKPSTLNPLAEFLEKRGYHVCVENTKTDGCKLGINTGTSLIKIEKMRQDIERLYNKTGKPVTVIGWSHGGHISHLLPYACKEGAIGCCISLGGPVNPEAESFAVKLDYLRCMYERFHGDLSVTEDVMADITQKLLNVERDHPAIKFVNIWSENDGFVPPQVARRNVSLPNVENVECDHAHVLLPYSKSVRFSILQNIADVSRGPALAEAVVLAL